MKWDGVIGGAVMLIALGLILRFGQSSTNLAGIFTSGVVKETQALTLSGQPSQTVRPYTGPA